jgi:hypothetical protein
MTRRDAAIRTGLILALAAGLTGCHDPGVGTIHADRSAVQELQRANSDRPSPPSKSARKRPDLNDLSPKLGGSEARP